MKRRQHVPNGSKIPDTARLYESAPGRVFQTRDGRRYRWEWNGQLRRLPDEVRPS